MFDNVAVWLGLFGAAVWAGLMIAMAIDTRRMRRAIDVDPSPSTLDFNFRAKCKRTAPEGSNAVPCLLCAGPCWGDMLDEANDRADDWKQKYARCAAEGRASNAQFAWLIERGSSPVESPSFFAGVHWGMGLPQWSKNNADAVRFARQEDAQRVSDSFPPVKAHIPPHRIAEHGWA